MTTRAATALVAAEARMVARDTSGLIVPLGMPLLILTMNGLGTSGVDLPGGLTAFDVHVVPLSLVVVVALVGAVNMPSFLAYYRKTGVLKSLAVTPVNPALVLVAQVVISVAQTLIGVALALTVAVAVFGMNPPLDPIAGVAVFGLAAAAMYSVGVVVAAISPTPNASVAIGLVAFFAMGATGGMFGPTQNLPGVLATIGEYLPFGAAVTSLGAAWQGEPIDPAHLVGPAVAIVLGSIAAVRFFRW